EFDQGEFVRIAKTRLLVKLVGAKIMAAIDDRVRAVAEFIELTPQRLEDARRGGVIGVGGHHRQVMPQPKGDLEQLPASRQGREPTRILRQRIKIADETHRSALRDRPDFHVAVRGSDTGKYPAQERLLPPGQEA